MKKLASVLTLVAVLVAVLVAAAPGSVAQAQGEAMVRVWHASPDAPAVDVYVNGKPAFTNLAFPNATAYANLTPGNYDIQVYPTSAGGTGTPVIDAKGVKLEAKPYTIMAIGALSQIKPLVLEDNLAQPAAGKAHVRFVHASPDAPAVDITTKDGTVVFPNVAFGTATAWTPLDAMTYDLQARVAGTDTVALDVPGVKLADGAIVTVAATGLLNGTPALAATTVTYEAVPATTTTGAAATTDMPKVLPQTGGAAGWQPVAAMLAGAVALLLGLAQRRRAVPITRD